MGRLLRVKNITVLLIPLLILLVVLGFSQNEVAEPETDTDTAVETEEVTEDSLDQLTGNDLCFSCHGKERFEYSDGEQTVVRDMYHELVKDPEVFAASTHGEFLCTDCHSTDYETIPHPDALRFELGYHCLDCHGGEDETWAKYHFETIEEEFNSSTHAEAHEKGFSCWKCHDAHSYKVTARNSTSIAEIVAYDNAQCLKCHGQQATSDVISSQKPEFLTNHEWLPNQLMHFQKVRCIDCHAQLSDSLFIPHNIRPKEEAVRNCVECHSSNSRLMQTLYKGQATERRDRLGFYNGVMMNEAYIIGANRNFYLNALSIGIFVLTLLAIAIHAFLRFSSKKK